MTNLHEIELFFDVGSPYSYLAATQAEGLEQRTGVKVHFRPFLLGAVFKGSGNAAPAQVASKAKWMLADLQHWARLYRVPLNFPTRFPLNTLATERAITSAERLLGESLARRFSLALFRAYWVDDRDVSARDVIADVARAEGLDDAAILVGMDAQETKDLLRARTDEALARGAFGAPTFFVGDELFFGNDRIALVERHLAGAKP